MPRPHFLALEVYAPATRLCTVVPAAFLQIPAGFSNFTFFSLPFLAFSGPWLK